MLTKLAIDCTKHKGKCFTATGTHTLYTSRTKKRNFFKRHRQVATTIFCHASGETCTSTNNFVLAVRRNWRKWNSVGLSSRPQGERFSLGVFLSFLAQTKDCKQRSSARQGRNHNACLQWMVVNYGENQTAHKILQKKSPNNSHQNRAHYSWEIPTHLSKSTRSAELRQLFFFHSSLSCAVRYQPSWQKQNIPPRLHPAIWIPRFITQCALYKRALTSQTVHKDDTNILKHRVCVVIKPALYCKTN